MQTIIQQPLGFYKEHPDVRDPHIGTQGAACFDLHAYFRQERDVTVYTEFNEKIKRKVKRDFSFDVQPGWRCLIPTGLIFDIPTNTSVRLHARSGLSLKQGLVLANSEGVIDSDYVDPVFAMITNISQNIVTINNHERICQAELVIQPTFALMPISKKPEQKTDRDGGFGSTGV
jgi:dUTP pyrophosphatase